MELNTSCRWAHVCVEYNYEANEYWSQRQSLSTGLTFQTDSQHWPHLQDRLPANGVTANDPACGNANVSLFSGRPSCRPHQADARGQWDSANTAHCHTGSHPFVKDIMLWSQLAVAVTLARRPTRLIFSSYYYAPRQPASDDRSRIPCPPGRHSLGPITTDCTQHNDIARTLNARRRCIIITVYSPWQRNRPLLYIHKASERRLPILVARQLAAEIIQKSLFSEAKYKLFSSSSSETEMSLLYFDPV